MKLGEREGGEGKTGKKGRQKEDSQWAGRRKRGRQLG